MKAEIFDIDKVEELWMFLSLPFYYFVSDHPNKTVRVSCFLLHFILFPIYVVSLLLATVCGLFLIFVITFRDI